MEKQPAQNIQDAFLNSARRERASVVVHLLPGSTLAGRIKSFDKFSVLLDVSGQDVLIFKHSISTISLERKSDSQERRFDSQERRPDSQERKFEPQERKPESPESRI